MNATNPAVLHKLAALLAVSPERDPWNKEQFTGTINAMGGRLQLRVGVDFVCASECEDNGYGYWLSQRSVVVPKGLSYAQIVEWVRAWIDHKPAMPDGTYRINGRDHVYAGPELNDAQTSYLMSIARCSLAAYPLGGSIKIESGRKVECWGSI
jgi:hypothetical protein